MSTTPQCAVIEPIARPWPPDLSTYDRKPLTLIEKRCLTTIMLLREKKHPYWFSRYKRVFVRLLKPIQEVLEYLEVPGDAFRAVQGNILAAMHQKGSCFWSWSRTEWLSVLGSNGRQFRGRYAQYRNHLIALAYVVGNFTDLHLIGKLYMKKFAQLVFHEATVNEAIERTNQTALKMGYAKGIIQRLTSTLCRVLLASRSPRVEDLTLDVLMAVRDTDPTVVVKQSVVPLSRVLASLAVIPKPLPPRSRSRNPDESATERVPKPWLKWVTRWRKMTTLERTTHSGYYYSLLKTGRWIHSERPELSSPGAWTYQSAIDYVAALMQAKIGDWSAVNRALKNVIGKPPSPSSITHSLAAMRTFFRDCQESGWIKRKFSPDRVFRTPKSIRAKIGPNPRVIDQDIWAKLLWAGLNLTEPDLPHPMPRENATLVAHYPLEMVRAIAVTWLFGALRNSELVRLRVGCTRWQAGDVTIPDSSQVLAQDRICWLDIPVNKTGTQFTKPVDPLVGKAIAAWENKRPHQAKEIDKKTAEVVDYLFFYRGKSLSRAYVNNSLISTLCRKAGVPKKDARGRLTSHRARATIASQLFNSKEPLTLFELQEWLGHKHPRSTQSYAKVTPTRLAKKYAEAGYFERNIRTVEVLIDRDAIVSGAAARGEAWQYYDLGHGWCTNTYFSQCPHRMACAKCSFYAPKDSAREQFLEAKKNLQLMAQSIPLTDEEVAAVDEGAELFDSLCVRLATVPTPAGPTPLQLQTEPESQASHDGGERSKTSTAGAG